MCGGKVVVSLKVKSSIRVNTKDTVHPLNFFVSSDPGSVRGLFQHLY